MRFLWSFILLLPYYVRPFVTYFLIDNLELFLLFKLDFTEPNMESLFYPDRFKGSLYCYLPKLSVGLDIVRAFCNGNNFPGL